MPRANRYILPGRIYHITHRCHDRQFLFKFAKDRNGYRRRLLNAARENGVAILNCTITSNHVDLIVCAESPEQVARLVQQAAGEFARDYNPTTCRCAPLKQSLKEILESVLLRCVKVDSRMSACRSQTALELRR